jgi:hypothetical protein
MGDPDLAAPERMRKDGALPVVTIRPAEHHGGKASSKGSRDGAPAEESQACKIRMVQHQVYDSRTYGLVSRRDYRLGGDNDGRENATQTKSRPSVTVNVATLRPVWVGQGRQVLASTPEV